MRDPKTTTVLILSGGMDSATLLYNLLAQGHDVHALSFDYGQRHSRELDAAACIIRAATHAFDRRRVSSKRIDLGSLKPLLAGSSQTDPDVEVPEGHYAEESMKLTVVPNRNMLMLAVATAFAISIKADYVAYGAHAGDHAIYPDCREEFASAMAEAIRLADWHEVSLLRPFVGMTKAEIASLGHQLGVPFDLTYSCYKGAEKHCGKCGTCTERRESFELAGVPDPTSYE